MPRVGVGTDGFHHVLNAIFRNDDFDLHLFAVFDRVFHDFLRCVRGPALAEALDLGHVTPGKSVIAFKAPMTLDSIAG